MDLDPGYGNLNLEASADVNTPAVGTDATVSTESSPVHTPVAPDPTEDFDINGLAAAFRDHSPFSEISLPTSSVRDEDYPRLFSALHGIQA